MTKKRLHLLLVVSWMAVAGAWAADVVVLRDGTDLEGRVIAERGGTYTFTDSAAARMQRIPKQAVQYVLYEDAKQAEKFLDLSRAARLGSGAHEAAATILPAKAFGSAILDAVREARTSIYITSYILTGHLAGPIEEFFELLRRKARAGLDVVFICEFSGGTRPSMRHATLNFADTLSRDHVQVLFVQGNKPMHKKMIIVDGRTVLLGSSNLTLAGTQHSNEINVRIRSKRFARQAMEDFKRICAIARPASALQ